MSVSLTKGGNVSLSKEEPGLTKILIGLGWDARMSDGADFDLDASAFLLGPGDRVRSDDDFIFYNNLRSADGSVEHTGDNRTGEGEGDDESLKVDLSRVPADVQKIAEAVLLWNGNRTWKVTEVAEAPDNTVAFAFATQDGSVVARFKMDRKTGRVTRTG